MMACAWLRKAEEDLLVAENELHNVAWASAFHAQQAAEKALKALLVALKVDPPRTHEIEFLLRLLEEKGVETSEVSEAGKLTDYAVEARYPDFEEEPTVEEAAEALELARSVMEWVKGKLRELGVECRGTRGVSSGSQRVG